MKTGENEKGCKEGFTSRRVHDFPSASKLVQDTPANDEALVRLSQALRVMDQVA